MNVFNCNLKTVEESRLRQLHFTAETVDLRTINAQQLHDISKQLYSFNHMITMHNMVVYSPENNIIFIMLQNYVRSDYG